jgi:hypothetical protein
MVRASDWHAKPGPPTTIGCAVVTRPHAEGDCVAARSVALWSGEEQGLRGSRAYVGQQFGTFEEPKPAYGKFAGYVNIDSGTGRPFHDRIRPPTAAVAPRGARAADLGVLGANSMRNRQSAT